MPAGRPCRSRRRGPREARDWKLDGPGPDRGARRPGNPGRFDRIEGMGNSPSDSFGDFAGLPPGEPLVQALFGVLDFG